MVRLAVVPSTFHARVIAARLGAEGFVTELRGNVDGIYPMGDVHVYVEADDLAAAQELLLADEVESAFEQPADEDTRPPARRWWVLVVAVVVLAALAFARAL
jgi:hypothetical protein